jgi:hypothetical protein
MQSKRVKLELTNDEALVLYDWLARFNQRDSADFADQAEERVLDLEAMLEKTLVHRRNPIMLNSWHAARANVRDA